MRLRLTLALALLAACERPSIEVTAGDSSDYNRRALTAAVDEFVANGRTAQAYAELAHAVLELRPGMDRTVAEERSSSSWCSRSRR